MNPLPSLKRLGLVTMLLAVPAARAGLLWTGGGQPYALTNFACEQVCTGIVEFIG